MMTNTGPKRGQRMATNQRHQANALRNGKKRKTSATNQGGASVGGGASA